MIARILIIETLLRIKLRNGNLKIVLAGSVKSISTIQVLFEKEKKA